MQPATSMSRLANCAPTKNSGWVASTSRPARAPARRPALRRSVQRQRAAQQAPQQRRQPRRPLVIAEHGQRGGGDPVEQRRLVEIGQAVQRGREPMARTQHFPGDADIAAFVGQGQRPQPQRAGEPDQQRSPCWRAMLPAGRARPGCGHCRCPSEGRYVGVAWEMLRSGDWLTPTLDGQPFFHKPPLFYWITASSLSVFGLHEWAGRLASLIGACAAAIAIALFMRRWRGLPAARASLLVLAHAAGVLRRGAVRQSLDARRPAASASPSCCWRTWRCARIGTSPPGSHCMGRTWLLGRPAGQGADRRAAPGAGDRRVAAADVAG